MKAKTKRYISLFLALVFCFSLLGTLPAFAATTVQAYMVNYPRQNDPNYGDSRFGHSANYLMSGWAYVAYERMTLHAIGSYNGQITCDTPTEETILVTAEKQNAYSSSLVIWSDGTWSKAGVQDTITYGENVSDSVNGYFELEMDAAGGLRIVKTSEDGNVSGIKFTITGEGCSERVRTGSDGTVDVTGLMPGRYTVTEINSDAYTPQDSQTVTIAGGESAVVTFNNTLKRGALQVRKSAEDNFIEGVTFHLYGTSASGLEVDEYAVTGEDDVAERSFHNVLKKFSVTVTKTDAETGSPRGDATLAGAAYGLYRGGELVDTYYTDENGQFTTAEYPCGDDWTIREISPSEGYLLDESVHSVGAEPGQYTVEHNATAIGVTEELIEGSIRIIKHIDAADEDVEIVPSEPTPEPTPEPSQEPIPETTPEPSEGPNKDSAASGNGGNPVPDDPETLPLPSEDPDVSEPPTEEEPEESEPPVEESPEPSEPPVEEDPTLSPEPIAPGDVELGSSGEAIEQPEEGAVFQIYLASAGSYEAAAEDERDILTTDADGIAVSKSLPYGQYRVHQTDGMPGLEFAPDFTVFISEDGKLYSYILNDACITSLIRIEKRDAETGDIITAAGSGFQIRDLSTGELVTQTVNYPSPARSTTFYTDDTGTLMLPEELPYGEYELIEVAACHGYILDSTPVPFTVDGSVRTAAGTVVDTITTGPDGTASSKELYLGKYIITETSAPNGMVLNTEPRSASDSTRQPTSLRQTAALSRQTGS